MDVRQIFDQDADARASLLTGVVAVACLDVCMQRAHRFPSPDCFCSGSISAQFFQGARQALLSCRSFMPCMRYPSFRFVAGNNTILRIIGTVREFDAYNTAVCCLSHLIGVRMHRLGVGDRFRSLRPFPSPHPFKRLCAAAGDAGLSDECGSRKIIDETPQSCVDHNALTTGTRI
jgi:hypothetical protein